MSDIYSKKTRSRIMSLIRGKGTKPELLIQSHLRSLGIKFKSNVKNLPGKPDIMLAKSRVAIFIHGCFWHGHSCKAGKLPATNISFWRAKILNNTIRDRKNIRQLRKDAWRVFVIWQCQIKSETKRDARLKRLIELIQIS